MFLPGIVVFSMIIKSVRLFRFIGAGIGVLDPLASVVQCTYRSARRVDTESLINRFNVQYLLHIDRAVHNPPTNIGSAACKYTDESDECGLQYQYIFWLGHQLRQAFSKSLIIDSDQFDANRMFQMFAQKCLNTHSKWDITT